MEFITLHDTDGNKHVLKPSQISCEGACMPWLEGSYGMYLYVVTNGPPLGAVWARDAEGALNELVDCDLASAIVVEDTEKLSGDELVSLVSLGNYGDLCDLSGAMVRKVDLTASLDLESVRVLCALVKGEATGCKLLSEVKI